MVRLDSPDPPPGSTLFETFSEGRLYEAFIYAPRIPADLLTRSDYTCSFTDLLRRNLVVPTYQGTPPLTPQSPPSPGGGWGVGGFLGVGGVVPGALGSKGSAPCRNDNVASREIGGGAGIAGAYKQVGGYARSV